MTRLISCLLLTLILASSGYASAHSGTLSGSLVFYQNQGNYCQDSINCTGANYTEDDHFDHFLPIPDTKVYVITQYGTVSGQSTTDANGDFSINWNDGSVPGIIRYFAWRYEHEDGRFRITNMSGTTQQYSGFAWNNGHSYHIGDVTLGNSGAPHALANVYDGARMMWDNTLSSSSVMQNYFTNVQIRAFEPAGCLDGGGNPIPGCCPTSCANGPNKRIRLDANAAYQPQSRVMHEMGHLASYLASPAQAFNGIASYCYDGESAPCGWDVETEENGSVQFEEGIATHFANVALYAQNAATPRHCFSSGPCSSASANNLELSLGTSCGADVNRHPIQAMRYLWDVYDNNSDYTGESKALSGWTSYTYMGGFGSGIGENGKNEAWNATLTGIVEADGRSAKDWLDVLLSTAGQNTNTQFTNNCTPVGD